MSMENNDTTKKTAEELFMAIELDRECEICEGSGILGHCECENCYSRGRITTDAGERLLEFLRRHQPRNMAF
jgi:DnaJ-class molecular chaperone